MPNESGRLVTIPNALTLVRIVLIVPFSIWAAQGRDRDALWVFLAAGLTDTLDGIIARRWGQMSSLGRLADPIADKLLTGVAYVVLSVFREGFSAVPLWVMMAVIGRDAVILAGSLWIFRRRDAARLKPTWLGKLNTFLEISVVVVFLAATSWIFLVPLLPYLYVLAATSIVVSGADYVRMGVRMMRDG